MTSYQWWKSSYSANSSNCVNVAAADDGTVRLRESDDPDTILTLTPAALHGLIRAAKAGRLS
ncbi:DUF397 domain-containing protein [Streptomyces sp. NPDC053079]|uniref:DUF397 domain-containing protein n=1 Tax=Streptomyces sp. NPDC053079 TaxID=3365697 RepID=UPI0037D38112